MDPLTKLNLIVHYKGTEGEKGWEQFHHML